MLLFLNVCKQTFRISHERMSQNVKAVLMWILPHIVSVWRQKMLGYFDICISVPLTVTEVRNISNKFYLLNKSAKKIFLHKRCSTPPSFFKKP